MLTDKETSARFSKALEGYEGSDCYYLEKSLTAKVSDAEYGDAPVAVYVRDILAIVGKDMDLLGELIEIVAPKPIRKVTDFWNAKPRGLANRS